MHVDDLLGAEDLAAEAGDAVLTEADDGEEPSGVEAGQGDRVARRLHVDDVGRAHDIADAAAGAFRDVDVLDHVRDKSRMLPQAQRPRSLTPAQRSRPLSP